MYQKKKLKRFFMKNLKRNIKTSTALSKVKNDIKKKIRQGKKKIFFYRCLKLFGFLYKKLFFFSDKLYQKVGCKMTMSIRRKRPLGIG
jgi:hypothetical protein